MGFCGTFCLVLITIFLPPLGVFIRAGCGADVLINICLTLLGFIPGHIHAFYILYIYHDRRLQAHDGYQPPRRAPGIYSDKVQTGGRGYGTMAVAPPPGPQQGYQPAPGYH